MSNSILFHLKSRDGLIDSIQFTVKNVGNNHE